MAEKKQKQMAYPTLIDSRTYTKDAEGKGVFLGTEQSVDPKMAMVIQQTLRPGGGAVEPQAQLGAQVSMQEDLNSLFSGENLSEEFKEKASVIFEAAINEKVNFIREQLIKEGAEVIQKEVNSAVETLATRLDEYLNYVVEEWMKENKLAVESGIRTEIAESFMGGLKNLFESHYVEIPENKQDILEDLFAENQELESALNKQIQENLQYTKEITKGQARAIFLEATSDLSRVDAERLASLAESIEFSNSQEFANKILILKESYLKAAPVAAEGTEPVALTEGVTNPVNVTDTANPMSVYVNALTRQVKNI